MTEVVKSPRVSPPTLTIGTLLVVSAATWLLGFGADDGSPESTRLVGTVEWMTWVFLAGLSMSIFGAILVVGMSAIVQGRADWGLAQTPQRRRYGYLVVAFLLMLTLVIITLLGPSGYAANLGLPVHNLQWRTRSLLLAGYAAGVPWLTLVWLAHAGCSQLKATASALPNGGMPTSEPATWSAEDKQVVDAFQAAIEHLRVLWRLMLFGVTAAAVTVVVAISTAGALRAVFIAYAPDRANEYPGSIVLLFGALFAALQATIGLPLVISWRARAREIVDRVYPVPLFGRPKEAWAADRARLETMLHLDIPLIRNPLAALNILAPLVISILAVFIPGLATR